MKSVAVFNLKNEDIGLTIEDLIRRLSQASNEDFLSEISRNLISRGLEPVQESVPGKSGLVVYIPDCDLQIIRTKEATHYVRYGNNASKFPHVDWDFSVGKSKYQKYCIFPRKS